MIDVHYISDRIHRALARSDLFVRSALLVRNQARCVLKYYLGGDAHFERNGEQLLARTAAPHCRRFIDVGANIGYWSEHFLTYAPADTRGLLFEPSASALKRLRQSDSISRHCEIVEAAVTDYIGTVEFFEEPDAGETSSIHPEAPRASTKARSVPCTTLQHALVERGWIGADFLKIDVEGFDLHVMRGAAQLVAERRFGIIQFEYNDVWANAGSTLFSARQLLWSAGYGLYILRNDGLAPFSYHTYGDFFSYANFVAVSPEWNSAVAQIIRPALISRGRVP